MKTLNTTTKKVARLLVLIVAMISTNEVNAQDGHESCAPFCEYWKITGKTPPKGSVSCIDRSCPICSKKQEKERKEKLEADKLAAQKRKQEAEQRKQQQTKLIADQKKQVAIQREKAKENELVLVAPKPRIESSKITKVDKISESELNIVDFNGAKDLITSDKKRILNDINVLSIKKISNYYYLVGKKTKTDVIDSYEMLNVNSMKSYLFPNNILSECKLDPYARYEGRYNGDNGNYDNQVLFYYLEGRIGSVTNKESSNLVYIWDEKELRYRENSFYDKEKIAISRKSNLNRISYSPPSIYNSNKHKLNSMFLFFKANNKEVYEILVYGFSEVENKFILIDQFAPSKGLISSRKYATFDLWGYWFGVTLK